MIWLIGLGGSLGASARFLLGNFISNKIQKTHPFPMGTWIVNMSGSFLFGMITSLYLKDSLDDWVWYFLGVGFSGAYTTFSTFGYETIRLIESNKIRLALIYVITSIGLGTVAAGIGLVIF